MTANIPTKYRSFDPFYVGVGAALKFLTAGDRTMRSDMINRFPENKATTTHKAFEGTVMSEM